MQGVSFVCFSVICNLLFLPPADALPTVTLGVILDFDSPVGKVAKTAITLAAHDVNADAKLLHGTRLILDLHNSPAQDPILGASTDERIVSSLGRMVVIVWLFVVLILTSSYTASLTSILTLQQMQPSIQDVDSLRASGAAVGYQEGSFVRDYLHTQLGISKRKLKPYSTPEEYAEALSKGAKKGGVAAIFDEIPSIRVFLSTHCGYTIAGPTYRTGGFGFVFPKGSPLVSDISKGVLALSESSKDMQRIETKWFHNNACNNPGGEDASNRLSMKSFWGLYLITGMAFMIALIIFFIQLCYDFSRDPNAAQEILTMSQSNTISVSPLMKSFAKFADRKSPSPANSTWNGGGINTPTNLNVSPSSFNIPTPFSFDDHGDGDDTEEIESTVEHRVSARSSSVSLCDQERDV